MLNLQPTMQAALEQKTHRRAMLFAIVRTDGVTLRFTDFQQPITYNGQAYDPVTMTDSSAYQAPAGLGERNRKAVGYLTSDDIAEADLRAGRYNDAQVTETEIDWMYPWAGEFYTNTYYITEIKWTGEKWDVQLDGLTTRLRQLKGQTITYRCRWELGDDDCGIDLSGHTDSGTVSSVTTARRVITTNLTGEVNGYYDFGNLEFTSGDNDGIKRRVLSYTAAGGTFTLLEPFPFDIATSDAFDVYPGCNFTPDHCKGNSGRPWSSNFANYGGFPHVPGTTKSLLTPDSK